MKFIKEHKTGIIIGFVCFVLAILMFIAIYSMINPSNGKDIYGSRTEGRIPFTTEIETIKTKLGENEIVSEIKQLPIDDNTIRVLKFIITVKDDTSIEDCKELGNIILENLSEEQIRYYDILIYITSNTDNIVGTHSRSSEEINWNVYKR